MSARTSVLRLLEPGNPLETEGARVLIGARA